MRIGGRRVKDVDWKGDWKLEERRGGRRKEKEGRRRERRKMKRGPKARVQGPLI
jgi:hypothetical protein